MADAPGFLGSFLSFQKQKFSSLSEEVSCSVFIISTPKWRQSTASEAPPPTAQPNFNSPFSCFPIILFYDAA
jgi:hypothetical protein